MVDPEHPGLSIVRQCALLSISRSHYYGPVRGESAENPALMRLIHRSYTTTGDVTIDEAAFVVGCGRHGEISTTGKTDRCRRVTTMKAAQSFKWMTDDLQACSRRVMSSAAQASRSRSATCRSR
jgi:hypothetical protein